MSQNINTIRSHILVCVDHVFVRPIRMHSTHVTILAILYQCGGILPFTINNSYYMFILFQADR